MSTEPAKNYGKLNPSTLDNDKVFLIDYVEKKAPIKKKKSSKKGKKDDESNQKGMTGKIRWCQDSKSDYKTLVVQPVNGHLFKTNRGIYDKDDKFLVTFLLPITDPRNVEFCEKLIALGAHIKRQAAILELEKDPKTKAILADPKEAEKLIKKTIKGFSKTYGLPFKSKDEQSYLFQVLVNPEGKTVTNSEGKSVDIRATRFSRHKPLVEKDKKTGKKSYIRDAKGKLVTRPKLYEHSECENKFMEGFPVFSIGSIFSNGTAFKFYVNLNSFTLSKEPSDPISDINDEDVDEFMSEMVEAGLGEEPPSDSESEEGGDKKSNTNIKFEVKGSKKTKDEDSESESEEQKVKKPSKKSKEPVESESEEEEAPKKKKSKKDSEEKTKKRSPKKQEPSEDEASDESPATKKDESEEEETPKKKKSKQSKKTEDDESEDSMADFTQ